MLEGLEQIDWKSMRYSCETIPDDIRSLLSQDSEVRGDALDSLLGSGGCFGEIGDATPHIIPFLLELLAHDETPDKAELLYRLSGVAERIGHSGHPIHMMRLQLKTYDALRAGLDLFISLLKDGSAYVRMNCIDMLQHMTDDVVVLVPELIDRFRHEQDEEVEVALLKSLKTLLGSGDWHLDNLRRQCIPFLKETVETHKSRKVRIAAARASLEAIPLLTRNYDGLSPQVPTILAREFFEHASPIDWMEEAEPSWHEEMIVIDLAKLNPQALLDLLLDTAIDAKQAHLIARGLLACGFLYSDYIDSHFGNPSSYEKKDEGVIYVRHHAVVRSHYRFQPARGILQAIADADKVWEIPTNLFSFFYGLPDSREGLRALLSQQGDT